MKGSARIIGSISGRGKGDGKVMAEAVATGLPLDGDALVMSVIAAGAYGIGIVTADAVAVGLSMIGDAVSQGVISGDGSRTQDSGMYHWLEVEPEETQEFTWLVPEIGIDYYITTSTNLHWIIK